MNITYNNESDGGRTNMADSTNSNIDSSILFSPQDYENFY